MRIKLIFLQLILLFNLSAQNNQEKTVSILAGTEQIKESANFGFVFRGGSVGVGFDRIYHLDERLITYSNEMDINALFSHQIFGLNIYLKPVELAYLFNLSEKKLYLGPSIKAEYRYQIYPDLQSGFDYWFTDFSLGCKAIYKFNLQQSQFKIKLNTSLLGLTSRQPAYRNPYFYDLGFGYAISHLHENLSFSTPWKYNTSDMEIKWKPKPDSRVTYGYKIRYAGYFEAPQINMITQSLVLTFNR